MKILILNKKYHPDIGGIETITKQYAEWLSSENHKVTVLTTSSKSNFKIETKMINNVKVIKHSPLFVFGPLPVSILYLFHYLLIVNKFDIVHIHEPFPVGSLLGSITKTKTLFITFHSDIVKQTGLLKDISVFLLKKSLHNAKLITTTSNRLLQSSIVLSKFKLKTKIIPLSSSSNSSITYSPNSYFLFIGRLSYYKGIEVLLMAIEKAKKLNRDIIIIGKGEKEIENMIYSYVEKYNNVIFYNEFLSEEKKQDYIKKLLLFFISISL
ncbi:glycosyltransferase [Flavobacteriaceae bacterium]|nr:glycosyltransferase [Flavobacteriaceae bacterium]